jgi:hypothetical protein
LLRHDGVDDAVPAAAAADVDDRVREAGDGEAGDGEAGDGEAGDGEPGDGEAGDGEPGDGDDDDDEEELLVRTAGSTTTVVLIGLKTEKIYRNKIDFISKQKYYSTMHTYPSDFIEN